MKTAKTLFAIVGIVATTYTVIRAVRRAVVDCDENPAHPTCNRAAWIPGG